MTLTPAAKASRAYEDALRRKGLRHVTVRLGEPHRQRLAVLAERLGSNKAAIETAIDRLYAEGAP